MAEETEDLSTRNREIQLINGGNRSKVAAELVGLNDCLVGHRGYYYTRTKSRSIASVSWRRVITSCRASHIGA